MTVKPPGLDLAKEVHQDYGISAADRQIRLPSPELPNA